MSKDEGSVSCFERCKFYGQPAGKGVVPYGERRLSKSEIFERGRHCPSVSKIFATSMIFLIFFIIFFVILTKPTYAQQDLVFTTNQTEYYYQAGQESGFVIYVDNSYGANIDGQFTYTVSMSAQVNGIVMQNQQTQSKPLSIEEKAQPIVFSLGAQQNVGDYVFKDAQFSYKDPDGIEKVAILPDITIHIVDQPPEEQQQQQSQSETKTKQQMDEEQKQAQEEAQKQREEQIKEQMRQQEQAKQFDSRMQNNQISQDTQALKDQMQQEMQDRQDLKEQIEQDKEFLDKAKDLLDQGYNNTDVQIDPDGNNSGDFNYEFTDPEGNKAELEGKVEDGMVMDLSVKETKSLESLLKKIQENPEYQSYELELASVSFTQGQPTLSNLDNGSRVTIPYLDQENKTAQIIVDFKDEVIEDVKLERPRSYWWLLSIPVILGLLALVLLRKKPEEVFEVIEEKPLDHRKVSLEMLEAARSLFSNGEKKEAYAKVSEALRFYFTHQIGDKKELTNNELISLLRSKKKRFVEVQKILNECAMVEFARFDAEDFERVMKVAGSQIR